MSICGRVVTRKFVATSTRSSELTTLSPLTEIASVSSNGAGISSPFHFPTASRYSTAVSPQINFSNAWTRGPLDNSPAAPFGQDFASFLVGLPTGGTMSRAAAYREKSSVLSFYAHDDWRAARTLTLNLGLR